MSAPGPRDHLLQQLVFPDRYEALVDVLGPEVSRLVVEPDASTSDTFKTLAEDIRALRQGAFVPVSASTGTGKSTLVNNLATFFPSDFRSSVPYTSATVTLEGLVELAGTATKSGAANEQRILPIIVDGRESAPPSAAEIAAIKGFSRHAASSGNRSVVLWPETSDEIAQQMSANYVQTAGSSAVPLPARVQGPSRETWQQIAIQTLDLANQASDLERLGVNPRDYDPEKSHTLGEFLRRISRDFTTLRLKLLRSTQKPLRLSIVFVSKSPDAGVLLQLTNSSRFGLLDGGALLSATRDSAVGKFWADHRGTLTQLIVQLDAHAFAMPPQVSVPSLRRFGPQETQDDLGSLKIDAGPATVHTNWSRGDLGRFLLGTSRETFENRGTPAATSTAAFELLAEQGFGAGRDKAYNAALLKAIESFLANGDIAVEAPLAENKLAYLPLIPDNSFVLNGDQHCIEYTWRTGEFLRSGRAEVANYILTKLQNYGRELGQI